MRRDAFLVVLALSGVVATAQGRHRFHPLTAPLERRLCAGARANLRAVARLGDGRGTGFLVGGVPGRDATGLVLTNEHVAAGLGAGDPVRFHDGSLAQVARTVASSPDLDYALLEVTLPAVSLASPVRLRAAPVATGEPVYAVSGAANPFALRSPLGETTVVRPGAVFDEQARKTGIWTIQSGSERGSGLLHRVCTSRCVWSLSFGLPNAPGASGSPVFSATSHDVIALHWGGGGQLEWQSSATPSYAILFDLRARGVELH